MAAPQEVTNAHVKKLVHYATSGGVYGNAILRDRNEVHKRLEPKHTSKGMSGTL